MTFTDARHVLVSLNHLSNDIHVILSALQFVFPSHSWKLIWNCSQTEVNQLEMKPRSLRWSNVARAGGVGALGGQGVVIVTSSNSEKTL